MLHRLAANQQHNLGHVDLESLLVEVWLRLERGESPAATSEMVNVGDALSDRLAQSLDIHDNRFSRRHFYDLFGVFHRLVPEPRPSIPGATYLDLGCGSQHPFGMAMVMCLLGAARGICVDLDPIQDVKRAARGLARLAEAMLQNPAQVVDDYRITRDQIERNLQGMDLDALRRGDIAGVGSRLVHKLEPADKLSLADASVQVVMSNSFLEHVEDVDAVLAEITRVTVKGGFAIHNIDGLDHCAYSDKSLHPLDFLRLPGRGLVRWCNRIRPLEFPALFEKHGMAVQHVRPHGKVTLTPQEIATFAPTWSSMPREVLETTQATIVTRRK